MQRSSWCLFVLANFPLCASGVAVRSSGLREPPRLGNREPWHPRLQRRQGPDAALSLVRRESFRERSLSGGAALDSAKLVPTSTTFIQLASSSHGGCSCEDAVGRDATVQAQPSPDTPHSDQTKPQATATPTAIAPPAAPMTVPLTAVQPTTVADVALAQATVTQPAVAPATVPMPVLPMAVQPSTVVNEMPSQATAIRLVAAPPTVPMSVLPRVAQSVTVAEEMQAMRSEFERHDVQLVQELQRVEQRLERVEAEEVAASRPLNSAYVQLPQTPQTMQTEQQFYVQQASAPPATGGQLLSSYMQPPMQAAPDGQQQPSLRSPMMIPLGMPALGAQPAVALEQAMASQAALQQEAQEAYLRSAFLQQQRGLLPLQPLPQVPVAQTMPSSNFLGTMNPGVFTQPSGPLMMGLQSWLPGMVPSR